MSIANKMCVSTVISYLLMCASANAQTGQYIEHKFGIVDVDNTYMQVQSIAADDGEIILPDVPRPDNIKCDDGMRDCKRLGFLQTVAECSGKAVTIKCPFDDTKVYCGGEINCSACDSILASNATAESTCEENPDTKYISVSSNEYCVDCNNNIIYKKTCKTGNTIFHKLDAASTVEGGEATALQVPYNTFNFINDL